jgi:hypothetical protein
MLNRRRNPWRKLSSKGTSRDFKISEFAQKELHIVKAAFIRLKSK